jgi:hypothetical protein
MVRMPSPHEPLKNRHAPWAYSQEGHGLLQALDGIGGLTQVVAMPLRISSFDGKKLNVPIVPSPHGKPSGKTHFIPSLP